MFLAQHICNTFCQQLELCSQRGDDDESDIEYSFVQRKRPKRKGASTAQKTKHTRPKQRSPEISEEDNDVNLGGRVDEEEQAADSP